MSDIFVGCSKCGQPLPVDAEAMRNALLLGQEVTAAHDVCPGQEAAPVDAPPLRRFRAQIIMWELPPADDPIYRSDDNPDGIPLDTPVTWKYASLDGSSEVEELAGVGHTVEAESFAKAVNGPFTTWLNRTWPKMQENAAFADLPAPSTAT